MRRACLSEQKVVSTDPGQGLSSAAVAIISTLAILVLRAPCCYQYFRILKFFMFILLVMSFFVNSFLLIMS